MNRANIDEYYIKLKRLRYYMEEFRYDACILARRDNFAWLTCGGDNKVLRSSETGFGILLVTHDEVCFIAQYMDYCRILDDEIQGLDINGVCLRWYEQSREEKAMELVKDKKCLSDIFLDGADFRLWDIYMLHYPLTEWEIARYIKTAALCEDLLRNIADNIRPGMTEQEIEAMVLYDYACNYLTPRVLLVGSDERISKYRHPNASPKKVEKLVLLHPAAEKSGLHINITRMVYFGDKLPNDLSEKYDLLNLCEAQAMAMTRPGIRLMELFKERKRVLKENGWEGEWKNHYPGAITGYLLGDAYPFLKNMEIKDKMSFEYFITLKGAKVEEVCISSPLGGQLISVSGCWPTKKYEWDGYQYNLPVIYQK